MFVDVPKGFSFFIPVELADRCKRERQMMSIKRDKKGKNKKMEQKIYPEQLEWFAFFKRWCPKRLFYMYCL